MSNTRLQIVSSILKIDRPFRAATVTDMLALDRQLIRYHLMQMVNEGLLEKTGRVYQMADKEKLFDSLVEIADKVSTNKMEAAGTLLSKHDVDGLNSLAESIVCARTFHNGMGLDAKDAMIKKLDKTMRELKQLRKFLNAGERSETSAAKKLRGKLDEVYEAWVTNLGIVPSVSRQAWKESLAEDIERVLDE